MARIVESTQSRRGESLQLLCDGGTWKVALDGELFAFRSERVARLAFDTARSPQAA